MKISEDRIVPEAAVCDRRRTDRKNPAESWSVAAFLAKPQIEPVAPTPHSPSPSSALSALLSTIALARAEAKRRRPCRAVALQGSSVVKACQTESKLVKVFSIPHQTRKPSAILTICCVILSAIHNQWWLVCCRYHRRQPIRNPQSAFRNSSWFHLFPLPATKSCSSKQAPNRNLRQTQTNQSNPTDPTNSHNPQSVIRLVSTSRFYSQRA